MALNDALTRTLRYSPELQQSPELALSVAQSNPDDGQTVAHLSNQANLAAGYDTVAKHVGGHSILGGAFHWLGGAVHHVLQDAGHTVADGLHYLNLPLQEIQHQYRYLHDVESRHGIGAALLEGLGITGGAAVGSVFGSPVLGGEVAAGLLGRLTFHDSWQRTQNGETYRDPTTNRPVSLGRDVANILGLKPSSKPFTIVSGLSDLVTDLGLDPVAQGLETLRAPATAEGRVVGGGIVGRALGMTPRTIGGTVIDIAHPEDVDRVLQQVPSVRRAFEHIASLDAGEIATRYGQYTEKAGIATDSPFIGQLGRASTVDQVADVFKQQAKLTEILSNQLPTRTFTQAASQALGRRLGEYMGPLSGVLRTTPYTLDSALRKVHELDVESNNGFKAVYDTFRFAMKRSEAESLLNEYIDATPAQRIVIYRQGIMNNLVELGLDPDLANGVKHGLEEATDGVGAGFNHVYGVDVQGRDLSRLVDAAGLTHQAGIYQGQIGKIAIPRWDLVLNEMRGLSNGKSLYGAADEWLSRNFTTKVFKPLALATLGFAQRMALAEGIPELLRHGTGDYFKNFVAARTAKLGVTLEGDELPHFWAAMVKATGGDEGLLKRLVQRDSPKVQHTADLLASTGAHITAPAVSSVHGYSEELMSDAEKAEHSIFHGNQRAAFRVRGGQDYETIGNGEARFVDAWQSHLEFPRRDPVARAAAKAMLDGEGAVQAARNALDELPPGAIERYKRSILSSTGADPKDDWSRVLVEALKGATHSPVREGEEIVGGRPIPGLLEAVADGKRVDRKILDAVPLDQRPVEMPARVLEPYVGTNRVTDWTFRKLGGFINTMVREPMMVGEYSRQFSSLQGALDQELLSHWEAVDLAKTRAVNNILPFIHNPEERALASVAVRNFMPFWFAQQQAYQRFGRLLLDNPAAFRREQLLISGLINVGHVSKDDKGQEWLNYPGIGFLTGNSVGLLKKIGVPLVGSLPVAMTGDVRSLNTVLPFAEGLRPSIGPAAAIPMRAIIDLFPEAQPLARDVLGDHATSSNVWASLLPNTFAQRMISAFGNEHKRAFSSAMMQTVQYLAHRQDEAMAAWVKAGHSEDDPDAPRIIPAANAGPIEQQAFIDRVKNQTRVNFVMRAFVGLFAPANPKLELGDTQLPDELRKLIKEQGLSKGTQNFLLAHPDATAYTVFQSKNLAGAPLPASRAAQDFYDTHEAFLRKYPNAGAWLLPQTGDFDQGVYNEQLAQHLRVKKAPEEFLRDIYTAAGNHQFFEVDKPDYDRQLQALKDAGDKAGAAQLRSQFNQYLQQRGLSNPVWWDDFQSADREEAKRLSIDDMRKMVTDPGLPHSTMTEALKSLLADYESFQSQLIHGRTDTDASSRNKALNAQWQAYLAKTAVDTPELKPLIRKIFVDFAHADPTQRTAIAQVFSED